MAGGAERVKIEWRGLAEIKHKLQEDVLVAEPMRAAMEQIADLGRDFATVRAPVHSGQTVNKLTAAVQRKPLPLWARVKTTAKNPRTGYKYPRRVEYSRRSRHFSWFFTAVTSSKSSWGAILDRASAEVEGIWGR